MLTLLLDVAVLFAALCCSPVADWEAEALATEDWVCWVLAAVALSWTFQGVPLGRSHTVRLLPLLAFEVLAAVAAVVVAAAVLAHVFFALSWLVVVDCCWRW